MVCLSIDGDGEDYSDIIEEYQRRGLRFRVINGEHGGPGAACQNILATTQSEYLIFLDSDDMLMPQAVSVLFKAIR
ncbi:MAG: glycosyltransferase [Bacillota bacterium]|nr:glycosyltransferase [Bacillota bacterium]